MVSQNIWVSMYLSFQLLHFAFNRNEGRQISCRLENKLLATGAASLMDPPTKKEMRKFTDP